LNVTASGVAAFAARYNTARLSSITESCRSEQISNSLAELAFAQLKLAAHEMMGTPAGRTAAHNAKILSDRKYGRANPRAVMTAIKRRATVAYSFCLCSYGEAGSLIVPLPTPQRFIAIALL
jgi:hypothetical protein